MNKLTKELIDQATNIAHGADNGFDIITFNKQKFAELIVKECVSIAKDRYDDSLPWGGVEDVLKHFGVEE